HGGVPGGAALPRRQGAADLRRHGRDPGVADRAQPPARLITPAGPASGVASERHGSSLVGAPPGAGFARPPAEVPQHHPELLEETGGARRRVERALGRLVCPFCGLTGLLVRVRVATHGMGQAPASRTPVRSDGGAVGGDAQYPFRIPGRSRTIDSRSDARLQSLVSGVAGATAPRNSPCSRPRRPTEGALPMNEQRSMPSPSVPPPAV